MTNKLYRCFDTDEETPVQFVGVHPLRWRPSWGEPTAMFREAEDAEIAQLPEVRALVEALQISTDLLRVMAAGMRVQNDDSAYRSVEAQVAKNNTALAPFDSPAQPTTFGEKSGRYEVEE